MDDSLKYSGWVDYINSLNAAIRENQEEKGQGLFRSGARSLRLDSDTNSTLNDYICGRAARDIKMELDTLRDPSVASVQLDVPSELGDPIDDSEDTDLKETRRRDVKNSRKNQKADSTKPNAQQIKEPKSRKKPTKEPVEPPEEEKEDKAKCQAKERAQKSRNRKKRYTEDLEQKVNILEKQVKYLTLELDKHRKNEMKYKVDSNSQNDSTKDEPTVLAGILDHLQRNTSKEGFTSVHTSISTKDGFTGEKRLRTMDKAFDVIANFLIPDTYSLTFYFMQVKEVGSDYIDVERIKKIRNYSKYQIQELYDKHEIDDCDVYWHDLKTTDEQAIAINNYHEILIEGKKKAREILITLNKLRDEMHENGRKLNQYPSFILPIFRQDQLLGAYEGIAKVKAEGKLKLNCIFGFSKVETTDEGSAENSDSSTGDNYKCIFDKYVIE